MTHYYFYVVTCDNKTSSGIIYHENAGLAFDELVYSMDRKYGDGKYTVEKFERVE